jgi:chromosome segregation protein
LQNAYDSKQTHLRAAQQAHANAAAEVLALARQQTRLEQAFSQRTGYAHGVKVVLRQNYPEVIAAVGDLLDIPDAYRAAITSALGRRAENIVIRQAAAAAAILQDVRQAGGYVTLLPLDLLHPSQPHQPVFAQEQGVIGLASELVQVDEAYRSVIWQLLGRTVIVETLEQATELAKRFIRRPRLVSLTGDIIESYGAISGGKANRGDDGRVLKRDVTATARALDATRQIASEHEGQYQQLNNALDTLRQQLQQGQNVLEHAQNALNQAREQHASQHATMSSQRAQYETTAAALANLQPPTMPTTDLVSVKAHLARLSEHLIAFDRQRQQLQRQYQQVSADRRIQQEQQRSYETALHNYHTSRARLERLTQERHHTHAALAQSQKERDHVAGLLATARAKLPDDREVKTTLEHAQTQRQQCQQAVETHNQHHAKNAAISSDINMAIVRKQASLEAADQDITEFPEGLEPLKDATTIRGDINTTPLDEDIIAWLRQLELWPEQTTLPKATSLYVADTSAKTLKRCLAEAEHKRAQLGAVNYRATQDQQDTATHLRDLSRDAKDAQAAVKSLLEALHELDDSIQSQLEQAVTAVRTRFQDKVVVLFGENAQADLRLTYEQSRPSGVTLALQPANKTTRSLNLLSVGERTMGAMAFLFALMEGEHALPIAILDEVDAPLDEANIRRFRDFVRKLASQGTQFLLITHQKATMECADVLWGVTTQDGVSRIFSIQRNESDESNDGSFDAAAD